MIDQKTDTYLFEYEGKKFFREDIRGAIEEVGVKKNDKLFIHADLKSFGKVNPHITKEEYIDAFIGALKEVIGQEGILAVPTFSYSFCSGEVYDPEETPSRVGMLTERFRKEDKVIRTIDPIFSVAIWGNSRELYKETGIDCFGKESIFQKIYRENFKILFIGETFDMTFLHFIEQDYGVSYRFIKKFAGKIMVGGELKKYTFDFYVRSLDGSVVYDLDKIVDFLDSKKVLRRNNLGYSQVRLVKAQDAYTEIIDGLKKDSRLLLKK